MPLTTTPPPWPIATDTSPIGYAAARRSAPACRIISIWPMAMRRAHDSIFFPANRTGAATLLFFHGGYWQRNNKEGFSFVAEGPLAHGFHVAVAGYTLAPEATVDQIVREARTALRWLHQHLARIRHESWRV